MSSPRGLEAGGMGGIGTDELRLLEPAEDGEGLRLRAEVEAGEIGDVG